MIVNITMMKETIAQLKTGDWRAMSKQITDARMAWLDRTLPERPNYNRFTPRQAYELLFFDNMQLDPRELPIVSESPDEVVWLSRNSCALLDACAAVGFDTRAICRPVNEKATQAFLSRINPEMRFHRSYHEIRPHAAHCREKIVRTDFKAYMRTAIQEGLRSKEEGNRGDGAAVVFDNRIIGQAHDTAVTERDPSLHAEMRAIRQAVLNRADADLCGAILFSTCEPCPMCTSLAVWANVTTIVYGVSIQAIAALSHPSIDVSSQEIVRNSPCQIEIIANVLHEECRLLYM